MRWIRSSFKLFEEPERQQRDVGEREVGRDHHEQTVNVQTVAGQRDLDQLDALRAQHLLDLARALLVDARRQADHRGLLLSQAKLPPSAMPVPEIVRRMGQPSRASVRVDRQFLAAADARPKPHHDGAATEPRPPHRACSRTSSVPRRLVEVDDLDALGSQGSRYRRRAAPACRRDPAPRSRANTSRPARRRRRCCRAASRCRRRSPPSPGRCIRTTRRRPTSLVHPQLRPHQRSAARDPRRPARPPTGTA